MESILERVRAKALELNAKATSQHSTTVSFDDAATVYHTDSGEGYDDEYSVQGNGDESKHDSPDDFESRYTTEEEDFRTNDIVIASGQLNQPDFAAFLQERMDLESQRAALAIAAVRPGMAAQRDSIIRQIDSTLLVRSIRDSDVDGTAKHNDVVSKKEFELDTASKQLFIEGGILTQGKTVQLQDTLSFDSHEWVHDLVNLGRTAATYGAAVMSHANEATVRGDLVQSRRLFRRAVFECLKYT